MVPPHYGSVEHGFRSKKRLRREISSEDVDCETSPELGASKIKSSQRRKPPVLVDWRLVLCQTLGLDDQEDDNDILDSLPRLSEKLEKAGAVAQITSKMDHLRDRGYQIMHRVKCNEQSTTELSLTEPWPVANTNDHIHLRCGKVVNNLELHLERNKDTYFLVFKDYVCCHRQNDGNKDQSISIDDPDALCALLEGESVCIVNQGLGVALEELFSITSEKNFLLHPKFRAFSELRAPYVWWYFQRVQIDLAMKELEPETLKYVKCFQEYINDTQEQTYRDIDQLLESGKIMPKYLDYLFVPGEIQLSTLEGDDARFHKAFKATSWLKRLDPDTDKKTYGGNESTSTIDLMISGTFWSYDGLFQQTDGDWEFGSDPDSDTILDIRNLDVYPLRFANPEVKEALRRRGEMFWECRWSKYICYHDVNPLDSGSPQEARYMIDYNTYKEMHPPPIGQAPNEDDLGTEARKPNSLPPSDDFLLCLPPTLPGYNMLKKEWITLHVSLMTDVQWNDNAFNKLVVEEKKKKLIRALVTTQIATEESTDLMSGKGNGLFILLHGGPGTGKTLTAESVAEIARKPLYRVACGDVGIKAEDVERYLETVLLLGKTWGCVVLLDEADVFLMQRSVEDFKRNALVSVFLRVLEYYNGILILTSNRVGTFDAAFKSRIQLSLHYPPLTETDRGQIWRNFIEHVHDLTKSQDTSRGILVREIMQNVSTLAKKRLNGREIRNAMSTARQLAMFDDEPMGYKHLDIVLSEMEKFDAYATELKGGMTDDMIARQCQEY